MFTGGIIRMDLLLKIMNTSYFTVGTSLAQPEYYEFFSEQKVFSSYQNAEYYFSSA